MSLLCMDETHVLVLVLRFKSENRSGKASAWMGKDVLECHVSRSCGVKFPADNTILSLATSQLSIAYNLAIRALISTTKKKAKLQFAS